MKFFVLHLPSRRLLPASSGWRRLFVVRLFLKSYFFVPYIVLYAKHLGFSLGLLLTVEAVFGILIVVFDLPAGHLADRIGPRQALLAGAFLEGMASLLLGGLANQAIFWIVQPLFAAAAALTQGADAGLAGLILRHDKALEDFEQGEQLFQRLALVWTAAVYGLASALSLVSLRLPFIATGVVQLLCGRVSSRCPTSGGRRLSPPILRTIGVASAAGPLTSFLSSIPVRGCAWTFSPWWRRERAFLCFSTSCRSS